MICQKCQTKFEKDESMIEELCQYCWEAYSGDQFWDTISGKGFKTVEEWMVKNTALKGF